MATQISNEITKSLLNTSLFQELENVFRNPDRYLFKQDITSDSLQHHITDTKPQTFH